MYANHEIKMPERYRELTDDEMQYDGGVLNFAAGLIASAVLGEAATGVKMLGNAGIIDKDLANGISMGLTVASIAVGFVSGMGVLYNLTEKTSKMLFAGALANVTVAPGLKPLSVLW